MAYRDWDERMKRGIGRWEDERDAEWGRGDRFRGGPDGGYGGYGGWRAENPGFGQQGHRGRGPRATKRSDERIRADLWERLSDDPWIDARAIKA